MKSRKQMDGLYFWLFCKNYLQPLELSRVIRAQDLKNV